MFGVAFWIYNVLFIFSYLFIVIGDSRLLSFKKLLFPSPIVAELHILLDLF